MASIAWPGGPAGGINDFDDPSSIPPNQVVTCSNYYPIGKRWRLIEGNVAVTTSGYFANRVRHLIEYQPDDGSGGTSKYLLAILSTGFMWQVDSPAPVALIPNLGPSPSQTSLYDHTVFQGTLYICSRDTATYTVSSVLVPALAFATQAGYIEAWKNRLMIANYGTNTLTVAYSAFGLPTTFTGNDSGTEVVTTPFGDFITGIRSTENYLAIFTRRTITLLIGDHPDNWTKRTIYEDHGTSSHRTVQRAFGGLIYANDAGVWFMDADGRRTELSHDIRSYWQNKKALSTGRNKARGKFMHAVYDFTPELNRYMIWVSEGTATDEGVCLIYHFNQQQWSRMDSFFDSGQACQASCLREDASGNIQPYFATGTNDNTTADKKIFNVDGSLSSFASRTNGNIIATLKTGIITPELNPMLQVPGLTSVYHFEDVFFKTTDTPSSGTLSFTFASAQKGTLTSQQTRTLTYTGSGNIIRERIPIGVTGYGLQITVSRTGQSDHDIIGGIIKATERGSV